MRRVAIILVSLAAVVALALVLRPTRPRVPHLDPPNPDRAGLEPALVKRIDMVRAMVADDPDAPEAWGRLAAAFDVHDFFSSAIICYEQAERLDPDDFRWPYLIGRCRIVGDQRAAMAAFERALALRDDYPALHMRLGDGHIGLGETDLAHESFTRAAELDSTLTRAQLGLGRVALIRGDASTALAHLERAMTLGAASGEALGLLAEAHRKLGNADAAAKYIARAAGGAKFEPLPDPIHRQLTWQEGVTLRWHEMRGEQYRRDGRLDLALAEWETAIRGNPDSARAHSNLGLLYAQAGRPADAIAMFTRVIELDPEQTNAALDIATLQIRQGQTDEGLKRFRAFCATHPDDAEGPVRLARALRGVNRQTEAEQILIDAQRRFPGNATVAYEYGMHTAGSGRMTQAAASFAAAARLDPSNPMAHVHAARALSRLGRFAEAMETVRGGLTALPDDPLLQNALAWMLATSPDQQLRDGTESLRLAMDLCRRTQFANPIMLDTLAAAYAETGDYDEAVRTMTRALELPSLASNKAVARRLRSRLPTYEKRTAHHDPNLNE